MAWITKTPKGTYQVRYRSPDRRVLGRTFRRMVDARKFANDVETRILRGEWVDPALGATTFADVAGLPGNEHLRASSAARDASYMRSMVLPYFGAMPVAAVAPSTVQGFVSQLVASGRAPATVRKAYQLAARVFAAAVNDGLIVKSPCRGVKLPRVEATEMMFLTPEQIHQLADVIDPRYRAMVFVGGYCGLRWGEAAALTRDDVDALRRSLTVSKTLANVSGRVFLSEPKTAAARRRMIMPQFVVDELAAHLATGARDRAQAKDQVSGSETGTGHRPISLVFPSPNGGLLRASNWRRRVWRPAVEKLLTGSNSLRFHDLRHSHVALLIANGEHPSVIAARLGHTSVKTVLDRYGHLYEGLDDAAAERLDAVAARVALSPRFLPQEATLKSLRPRGESLTS